jgi:hypothetical protein
MADWHGFLKTYFSFPLNHCLLIIIMMNREEMKVQKMGKKVLCMNQYARVFSECRVPGKEVDKLKILFKPGNFKYTDA